MTPYGPVYPVAPGIPGIPGMPQPVILPYVPNVNWSHPELYNDMATAVGLGMGTPFQSRVPGLPSGQPGVPLPDASSSPSVIGELLDGMPSPNVYVSRVQDDIERANVAANPARHGALVNGEWKPTWTVVPLRAFRGREFRVVDVQSTWDDEQLLIAIKEAYKGLRVWYYRWFSLKGLSYITRVKVCSHLSPDPMSFRTQPTAREVNDAWVFPQRVGPGRTTPHRNQRLRYLLDHPEHMRGKHDFMRALTGTGGNTSAEYGIEFVERWNMARVCVVVVGSALVSFSVALTYGSLTADWTTGFNIASFFSQTFAQMFVLVGCLEYYEF
ncbi:hypothetical protein C8Q70DRAFT_1056650 [Cubamyces menziesii]|nr:hypothetical protein C8Q70DRAFT_1056650 [Cubamyces menziesii]